MCIRDRYGGTISAPVAQKVFASVLPYLNIETKYTEAEMVPPYRKPTATCGSSSSTKMCIRDSPYPDRRRSRTP